MTQIEISEPLDPALTTKGFKAEDLGANRNFFDHWKFEFGYCPST